MKKFFRLLILSLLLFGVFLAPRAGQAEPSKNVILMISDGCGYNQIRATDMYWGTSQAYENFPVQVPMSTYSWTTMNGYAGGPYEGYDATQAWSDFLYMMLRPTDSASAATAMSTGVKNRDGQLNVDPIDAHRLFTDQERAIQLGKSTGVITTVPWSHATPAGWAAHNTNRNNYAGIAVEMLDSTNLSVIMGAGHPDYTEDHTLSATHNYNYVGGQEKWNQLVNHTTPGGWTLIQDHSEFQALQSGPTPNRVCGTVQCASTCQQSRSPQEGPNDPVAPYTVPLNDVPSLAEMTRGAINVLDNNPNGFFLMIEGGAIDWAGHANQHGRLIEEETDFNQAVDAVIAWVEANSNWNETLLIVTGDHECGYLWGPNSGVPATFAPLVDNGAGHLPGMWYYSGNHSNELIPVFAKGEGSAWLQQWATHTDPIRGNYIDDTDIARLTFGYYDNLLAVELQSFDAVENNGQVTLNWVTASETQNSRFEIVRDGNTSATIASQGNSSSGHQYSWTDTNILPGHSYNYSLVAVDVNGTRTELGHRTVNVSETDPAAVSTYALRQNYPNPFNPSTQIAFDLPQSGSASLTVFNAAGQQVATLLNGDLSAGHHNVSFDASNLPSGIYFYKLSANGFESARKMLLVK